MVAVFICFLILCYLVIRAVIKKKRPAQWVCVTAAFCVVYMLTMKYIGGIYNVPSASMEPSLSTGDLIVGVKVNGLLEHGPLKRGDVAAFDAPAVPRTLYIKRVIGIPGDVVEYHADKSFTVNGKTVGVKVGTKGNLTVFQGIEERNNQHYTFIIDTSVPYLKSKNKWEIPQGYYFFAGDNRDHSWDGRYWENPPGTPKALRGLVSEQHIQIRYVTTLVNIPFFKPYDPLEAELRIVRNNDH